jgi:RNA polymerase sigma-70 factor (ECF subfamily)
METSPDKEAFLRLVQENRGIIIKICRSYCRYKNDREDLAQDIIYQLWKSGHRFNADYKFSTWMYRVALNTAISYYRREKRAHPVVSFSGLDMDVEDKADSGGYDDNLQLLQRFIGELNDLDRALILLYLEERPYSEIADIMGITETNTATRISRVKEKLKHYFSRINK